MRLISFDKIEAIAQPLTRMIALKNSTRQNTSGTHSILAQAVAESRAIKSNKVNF